MATITNGGRKMAIDYTTYPALEQAYDEWAALYTRKHDAGQFAPFTQDEQAQLDAVNDTIKALRACANTLDALLGKMLREPIDVS